MSKSQESIYGRITEEEYRDLYHRAPCGYVTTMKDGLIISINRTLADWMAFDPVEIVGRQYFRQLLTPASQIFVQTHCAPLLQFQGWISEVALELLRPDQTALPVLMSAIQDSSGPENQVVNRITLFNATDRRRYENEIIAAKKRAEELSTALQKSLVRLEVAHKELAEQNAELSAIYSGLPVGFFRIDQNGSVMHSNKMFTDMTGCTPGALLSEWLAGLQSLSIVDLQRKVSLSLISKQPCSHRFRCEKPSKHSWHELTLWPVDPSEGIRDGFLGVLRDVTIEVHAEEHSKQYAAQQAANEVASGVAHNFNSLWSVILASVEQSNRRPVQEQLADQWSRLGKLATERGAEITKKLMAFSGQLHLKPTIFDLGAFLDETIHELENEISNHHFLRIKREGIKYLTNADRTELKAVLLELIRNAAQASPPDSDIDVYVTSVHNSGNEPRFQEISICDYGSGMDSEILKSIEMPFFTTKEIGNGIGLGLSYARGFANQAGGYLKIDSSPGKGTIVKLGLPSAQSDPA